MPCQPWFNLVSNRLLRRSDPCQTDGRRNQHPPDPQRNISRPTGHTRRPNLFPRIMPWQPFNLVSNRLLRRTDPCQTAGRRHRRQPDIRRRIGRAAGRFRRGDCFACLRPIAQGRRVGFVFRSGPLPRLCAPIVLLAQGMTVQCCRSRQKLLLLTAAFVPCVQRRRHHPAVARFDLRVHRARIGGLATLTTATRPGPGLFDVLLVATA